MFGFYFVVGGLLEFKVKLLLLEMLIVGIGVSVFGEGSMSFVNGFFNFLK